MIQNAIFLASIGRERLIWKATGEGLLVTGNQIF